MSAVKTENYHNMVKLDQEQKVTNITIVHIKYEESCGQCCVIQWEYDNCLINWWQQISLDTFSSPRAAKEQLFLRKHWSQMLWACQESQVIITTIFTVYPIVKHHLLSPQTGRPYSKRSISFNWNPPLLVIVGRREMIWTILYDVCSGEKSWQERDMRQVKHWLHLGSNHQSGVSQLLYLHQVPTTNNTPKYEVMTKGENQRSDH